MAFIDLVSDLTLHTTSQDFGFSSYSTVFTKCCLIISVFTLILIKPNFLKVA